MSTAARTTGAGTVPKRPRAPRWGEPPGKGLFAECGHIARFVARVIREVPITVRKYPSEILRQAGIMLLSSSMVIWFLMMTAGTLIGMQGYYVLNNLGASGYVGLVTAVGDLKAFSTFFFSIILGAKVGCGFVAELGSMRISEEIDALEVMGVESRPYLAGSRFLAFLIAAPLIFLIGLGIMFLASYVTDVHVLQAVSAGGYSDVFWAFQTPPETLLSVVSGVGTGAVVAVVGCYYGFYASGGPVGVGQNTARSMVVNLILISVVATIFYQAFFGIGQVLPIVN